MKRIVTIHAVSENAYSTKRLEKYIKTIRGMGFSFVDLQTIVNNTPIERRKSLIALTFDDGYLSTLRNAVPILKKYNVPATLFVPTGLMGFEAGDPHLLKHECYKNEATMSMEDVKEWVSEGFGIGFHTHEHIDLYDSSDNQIINDFKEGLDVLRANGWATPFFAYPKGFLPRNRKMFEKILVENGFKFAFTINHGDVNENNPYYINRVCLGNNESFLWSIMKTTGFLGDLYFKKWQQVNQQLL